MAVDVRIGSNHFLNVQYPLVVSDRFFEAKQGPNGVVFDVFRYDPSTQKRIYEVQDNKPMDAIAQTNPTGIVTFGSEQDGFLFKLRPQRAAGQIFGRIPLEVDYEVRVTDHVVTVTREGSDLITAKGNSVTGSTFGFVIEADGGFVMGSGGLLAPK